MTESAEIIKLREKVKEAQQNLEGALNNKVVQTRYYVENKTY